MATCGALSYWRPTRHAHLVTAVVGAGLIAWAYRDIGEPPPAAQNEAAIGLLLLMFAILPNQADRPPRSWEQRRVEQRSDG